MRYFAEIAYNGANYNGWQVQPNAPSVQATIEDALSTILNTPTQIVGCGRTDTGVHAKNYYAHFDFEGAFPLAFLNRVNKYLPKDIVIYDFKSVANDAHARFDAYARSYEYHIVTSKNPFEIKTSWDFYAAKTLDIVQLQAAAALLLQYNAFAPFCKTHSDAKTMICEVTQSKWEIKDDRLIFHITANRFLRGMVRLIVGMCINVSLGKLTLEQVKQALDTQSKLPKSYSVPPNGLFLTNIKYPYPL